MAHSVFYSLLLRHMHAYAYIYLQGFRPREFCFYLFVRWFVGWLVVYKLHCFLIV